MFDKKMKKRWEKLKEVIQKEIVFYDRELDELRECDEFAECLEYKSQKSAMQFILNAMEELEGTAQHNIFSIKR